MTRGFVFGVTIFVVSGLNLFFDAVEELRLPVALVALAIAGLIGAVACEIGARIQRASNHGDGKSRQIFSRRARPKPLWYY